jgi:hypothetical protein
MCVLCTFAKEGPEVRRLRGPKLGTDPTACELRRNTPVTRLTREWRLPGATIHTGRRASVAMMF